jgi:hypothetical protein
MIDIEKTIISQYSPSTTIVQLIQNMNTYIDPRTDFDQFFNFVWNVETAQGFGLDIWGRIVVVGRELTIPGEQGDYFGFQTADDDWQPFNQAPFYNRNNQATDTYMLSDSAYRRLILTKALTNISATTAPAINRILTNLFVEQGRAYCLEVSDRKLQYCFEFELSAVEYAIMTQSNAVARPAGVEIEIVDNYTP